MHTNSHERMLGAKTFPIVDEYEDGGEYPPRLRRRLSRASVRRQWRQEVEEEIVNDEG